MLHDPHKGIIVFRQVLVYGGDYVLFNRISHNGIHEEIFH